MAQEHFPHIFIKNPPETTDYTSPKGGGGKVKLPDRNRRQHGTFLRKQFEKLWQQAKEEVKEREAVSLPTREGFYIEFKSKVGFDLITKSLENIKSGIRLLNIRTEENTTKQQGKKEIIIATVYIPYKKADFFLKKINKYLQKNTKSGKPKYKNLIESIEEIHLAVLESFFYQADKQLIPKNNKPIECEVWLRSDKSFVEESLDKESKQFFNICDKLNKIYKNKYKRTNYIEYKREQIISFPERVVILIKANKKQLIELIKSSDQIAELRRAKETARFWLEQENKDQVQWVEDLQGRLNFNKESNVSVCLLDTGVNNGHPLISPVLSDKDCHTVNPTWGTEDKEGHGTQMSGLAIYGDLEKALEDTGPVTIHHKLESVKLIPKSGQSNSKDLYGDLTKQGINRSEIEKPDRKRTVCMAITSTDDRDKGRPSSWSGAIDQISSGAEENNKKRLLIVSAGNVEGQEEWKNYPESNLTNTVHDPAQSWNALTVGAYTNKINIKDPNLKGYSPIAKQGELSPFSTTSFAWKKKWPIKPDIVMEGGNIAKNETDFVTVSEDLSLLSLHNKPQEHQFEMIHATSAAAAQASWIAAQIQAQYPEVWPETIRALMIHSSKQTESMEKQFWKNNKTEKDNYKTMLRTFGYGVPHLDTAVSSYRNSLILVSEQELQPFTKKEKSSVPSTKDMHFYEMPWPKDALKALPDNILIKLRFTLSYFIEPGPGEIGWKDKYRYPSYGLRFSLINPHENKEQFKKRINKSARDEDEKTDSETDSRWMFGANNRNLGSIHSDVWQATARDIAECNTMAVYPTIGWWKTRPHLGKWNKKARYSLIVSLSTQEEQIDIYTPVAAQIGIPVTT